MYSSIDDIKLELRELCIEYVNILEKLKNDEVISHETYEQCTSSKISFLQE